MVETGADYNYECVLCGAPGGYEYCNEDCRQADNPEDDDEEQPMPNATITAEDIINRYGADIACVAETTPATDLDAFIDQLYTAARRFGEASVNNYEDLEAAAVHLSESSRGGADETARDVFLSRADELLADVWDMTQDYRCMVGG
jgi:hypothetical protein